VGSFDEKKTRVKNLVILLVFSEICLANVVSAPKEMSIGLEEVVSTAYQIRRFIKSGEEVRKLL
jgi:hypothetical protein